MMLVVRWVNHLESWRKGSRLVAGSHLRHSKPSPDRYESFWTTLSVTVLTYSVMPSRNLSQFIPRFANFSLSMSQPQHTSPS